MRSWILMLCAVAAPAFVHADDTMWRWTDAAGTVHYSNMEARAPGDAQKVETRIIREVNRIPDRAHAIVGDRVMDAGPDDVETVDSGAPVPRPAARKLKPIYNEDRRRFGCYAAGFLYNGGWAHADDISPILTCDAYLYGVGSWLNSAKAELALRANGIDARQLYRRYRTDLAAERAAN